MGLTNKEDVADIRESPAGNMVHELKEYDVDVYGYDPLLPESVIRHFGANPLQKLDNFHTQCDSKTESGSSVME